METNENKNFIDLLGISVGGPFSEIKRLTKYLEDYFKADNSPVPLDTIIKISRLNYSLRETVNKINTAANEGITTIVFFALVNNSKFNRYTVGRDPESVRYMLIDVIHHKFYRFIESIEFSTELIHAFFGNSDSPLSVNTIIGESNDQFTIKKSMDEINKNCFKVKSELDSLYNNICEPEFLIKYESSLNSLVANFLYNLSH